MTRTTAIAASLTLAGVLAVGGLAASATSGTDDSPSEPAASGPIDDRADDEPSQLDATSDREQDDAAPETSPDTSDPRNDDAPTDEAGPDHSAGQQGDGHGMHGVTSELDFLVHMIPHHQEAVDSAEQLLDATERDEMRQFAREIIAVQTAEIEQMEAWLDAWYPEADRDAHYEPMMRDLTGLSADDTDRIFLEDMIPHHMSAVMMAQQLLNGLVENDPIVSFAQDIRNDQRNEIMQMRRWLADWYDIDMMDLMDGDMMPGMDHGDGHSNGHMTDPDTDDQHRQSHDMHDGASRDQPIQPRQGTRDDTRSSNEPMQQPRRDR